MQSPTLNDKFESTTYNCTPESTGPTTIAHTAGGSTTAGLLPGTLCQTFSSKCESAKSGETNSLASMSDAALTEKISDLGRARSNLLRHLDSANTSLRTMLAELAYRRHGVKVGSIVQCKGQLYRLVFVRVEDVLDKYQNGKPWVRGVRKKKDGTWSTQVRHLFNDWSAVV